MASKLIGIEFSLNGKSKKADIAMVIDDWLTEKVDKEMKGAKKTKK